MEEPITEEMLQELLDTPDLNTFLEKTEPIECSLSNYLNDLLTTKKLNRTSVIKDAGINSTFGYQIFTGARKASRNNLLKLAFAMELSLNETAGLLQSGGVNGLYCKTRRDAIIIFALSHGYTLQQTEEELYRFGEETLS